MSSSSSAAAFVRMEDRNNQTSPTTARAAVPTAGSSSKISRPRQWGIVATLVRSLLLDLPLLLVVTALAGMLVVQHVYLNYVTPLIESNRRGAYIGDFYQDYENEFTYYNRRCGPSDISTTSSSDLLIHPDYTAEQAANVMLQHGAVAFRNVLNNETVAELRAYLKSRHDIKESLPYNEKFWSEISRLSLGIGTRDHPTVIAQALQQVGTHPVIQRTLQGILGPDPAILEVSTLTSLNGAADQGIHTDSDWFGSSLLYARTFLHSYTMFVALQDTSKALGATTICPGTHYCADPDLEDVCLDNGAFEVSTNGYTGDNGLLYKGDAFLFNQNIWHRGPKNVDPDGKDRIMFILTFATRTKDTPGDRRRQGLGTYYYQRWNMWGHTFDDLKNAGSVMIQPWAALRALGLWIPAKRKLGVTWLEQFSQQIANGDEFFAEWELPVLKEQVFDYYHVPAFLQSSSEDWEDFIVETLAIWISFLVKINLAVLAAHFVVSLGIQLLTRRNVVEQKEGDRAYLSPLLKRMALIAGVVCLAAYGLLFLFERSVLAKTIKSGEIFVRPFPSLSDDDLASDSDSTQKASFLPTTLPRRTDVLISTRYDAEFLASYDRFVDFHPGNRRWNEMVERTAQYHNDVLELATKALVKDILEERDDEGVLPRFLLQDPFTGYWRIMPESDALEETRRAVQLKQNPLLGYLAKHLKHVLADARFGAMRNTVMSKNFVPIFVSKWNSLLFGRQEVTRERAATVRQRISEKTRSIPSILVLPASPLVRIRNSLSDKPGYTRGRSLERRYTQPTFAGGHCAWVYEEDGKWYQAHLLYISENGRYKVKYVVGGYGEVHPDDLRHCEPLKEGDRIEVDYYRNEEEFYPGVIASVHPDGRYEVEYDDGEIGTYVEESFVYPLFE